jgi:hypothetical protein
VSNRRASKLVSHRIKPSRVVLSAALVHRNHLHTSEMRSNRKSTATSHHFDHPLFFPPALSLSLSHTHSQCPLRARHLNHPQKYNGVPVSRLGSATESPTHEPWDYLAKLPVKIAEPYTARAVQYIMRPLLSSVWKRLQPQIRTGPVTNRFTHFSEARSLPSPEERDRGAAASQKI